MINPLELIKHLNAEVATLKGQNVPDDLANQIANLKQRIKYEGSFSHLEMVHDVLPVIINLERELSRAKGNQP